jgi:hypothetical protein
MGATQIAEARAEVDGRELRSSRDVARELGVTPQALADLVHLRRIPRPLDIGGSFVWTPADVERARRALASKRASRTRRARRWLGCFVPGRARPDTAGADSLSTVEVAALFGVEVDMLQQHLAKGRVPGPSPNSHRRTWTARDIRAAAEALEQLAEELRDDLAAEEANG